jgi:hypothetical protein
MQIALVITQHKKRMKSLTKHHALIPKVIHI